MQNFHASEEEALAGGYFDELLYFLSRTRASDSDSINNFVIVLVFYLKQLRNGRLLTFRHSSLK